MSVLTRADVWLDVVVNQHVSLQPDPLGEDLLAVRADVARLPLPRSSPDALLAVVLEVRLVRGLRDLPLALGASRHRGLQCRALKQDWLHGLGCRQFFVKSAL